MSRKGQFAGAGRANRPRPWPGQPHDPALARRFAGRLGSYARDPSFYSGTFCVGCGQHFKVGAEGEFHWKDSEEKVGT